MFKFAVSRLFLWVNKYFAGEDDQKVTHLTALGSEDLYVSLLWGTGKVTFNWT